MTKNVLGQFADQINQLKGRQTLDSPDFNSITNTGVYYITNNNAANMKNNPVYTSGAPVSQWGVLVVSSGKGQRTSQVYYPDNNVSPFCRVGTGSTWQSWYELSTQNDISNLQNKLAQYTVDYNNNYVHDTTIDFNSYLHETRTIKVANVKANNGPLANTATIWGWLTTYHWDDNSVTQEYRDAGGEVFWRATSASASRQWTWHKYAKQEDIDNQQRQINDLINNINYIKDNYVEGRRFPASQEAQAEAWENENPQRIAFITK